MIAITNCTNEVVVNSEFDDEAKAEPALVLELNVSFLSIRTWRGSFGICGN